MVLKTRVLAAVLGAVVVSTVLTACGASVPGSSAPPLSLPSGDARPPGVRKGVPQDITAMILPATGADTRLTRGLDGFAQTLGHARLRECVQRQGVSFPDVPPPAYIGWSDLPDLEFIGRHGLTLNVPVPQSESSIPAGRKDPGVQRRCGQDARAVVKEFKDLYGPLQSQWWPEVSAVRDDPRSREALRGLPGCLDRYGIHVDGQEGFFALVDRTVQGIEDPAEAARADRGLGAAYSVCMAPVEVVRELLRISRRTVFQESHRDEIAALRRTLPSRIREFERRYGVTFAQPVP
ncbi:hypothetical protein ACF07V_12655 [Streptomyces sp. NPDC015661]|uniref:hypothetical protein n=1 Tax=Streptomyces sp. NPDC015661 TaxID=3364961 RepID=UPI0036F9E2A8